MPGQLHLEYPGAVYHVVNRGDRREEIFRDDPDRERCLSTLTEACGNTGWQVHPRNGWTEQELRGAPKGDKWEERMAANPLSKLRQSYCPIGSVSMGDLPCEVAVCIE